MTKRILSILFMTVLFTESLYIHESYAWLIFYKPEYKGKILDADTNEPIEGVVVVAFYTAYRV